MARGKQSFSVGRPIQPKVVVLHREALARSAGQRENIDVARRRLQHRQTVALGRKIKAVGIVVSLGIIDIKSGELTAPAFPGVENREDELLTIGTSLSNRTDGSWGLGTARGTVIASSQYPLRRPSRYRHTHDLDHWS